jgi:hypothetical protein
MYCPWWQLYEIAAVIEMAYRIQQCAFGENLPRLDVFVDRPCISI